MAEFAGPRRRRRRLFGLVLLLASIGQVLLGQYVWESSLVGWSYIWYWGSCAVLVVLALMTAVWDMIAIRREAAREKNQLIQKTLAHSDDRNQACAEPDGNGDAKP
jgi:hypothetical protein